MSTARSQRRTAPIVGPRWRSFASIVGPGLLVMLADTEVGSVLAAAQSGADWGYRLVVPQLLLIPALFMAQELAGRLGLVMRLGIVALVLHRFGRMPATLLLAALAASCVGTIMTELSGIAGVGELYGLPAWQSSSVAALGLLAIVCSGRFRLVELAAIAAGFCEVAFIALAVLAHPAASDLALQVGQIPFRNQDYLYLLAANLGTCVIPWNLAYQQSASTSQAPTRANLATMRVETLLGAVFCQIVTVAVVVASAATFHHGEGTAGSLHDLSDVAIAFTDAIGPAAGGLVFAIGVSAGALVAATVVALAAARAFQERVAWNRPASGHPSQRHAFRAGFALVLVASAGLIASGANLMRLAIAVGAINALLLPIVLWFIFLIAWRHLPPEVRLRGTYAVAVGIVLGLTASLGMYAGLLGLV